MPGKLYSSLGAGQLSWGAEDKCLLGVYILDPEVDDADFCQNAFMRLNPEVNASGI